jgi:hypothetical protein
MAAVIKSKNDLILDKMAETTSETSKVAELLHNPQVKIKKINYKRG